MPMRIFVRLAHLSEVIEIRQAAFINQAALNATRSAAPGVEQKEMRKLHEIRQAWYNISGID